MADSGTTSDGSDYGNGALALSIAGGLSSAYGAYTAGVNNRRIARYNASIARIQAFQATQRATWEADRIRTRTGQVVSGQRASYAGQGVVVGDGSTADVAASTEAIGAGDVQQAQMNGIMEAWGYETRATSLSLQGQLDYLGGINSAAGSALGTAGQAYEFEYGMHH